MWGCARGQPSWADFAGYNDDEIKRTLAMRVVLELTLAAGIGPNPVHAADLAEPLAREIVRQDATSAYGHGGFNPILDPRCRIHSKAGSDPLSRHRAFSPDGGLRVTRSLRGFGPVSVAFL
jgi:hypothetical protein